MPDLVIENKEIIRHYDERCISCLVQDDDCPLIAALKLLKIVDTIGVKVWDCAGYEPDKESPHYEERVSSDAMIKEFTAKVERLWPKLS